MKERRCETCAHAHKYPEVKDGGSLRLAHIECRRFPPSRVYVEYSSPYDPAGIITTWPVVEGDDWCSEWTQDTCP